jgi:hypothetical protein
MECGGSTPLSTARVQVSGVKGSNVGRLTGRPPGTGPCVSDSHTYAVENGVKPPYSIKAAKASRSRHPYSHY